MTDVERVEDDSAFDDLYLSRRFPDTTIGGVSVGFVGHHVHHRNLLKTRFFRELNAKGYFKGEHAPSNIIPLAKTLEGVAVGWVEARDPTRLPRALARPQGIRSLSS